MEVAGAEEKKTGLEETEGEETEGGNRTSTTGGTEALLVISVAASSAGQQRRVPWRAGSGTPRDPTACREKKKKKKQRERLEAARTFLKSKFSKNHFHFFVFLFFFALHLPAVAPTALSAAVAPTVAATTDSSAPRHATPNPVASCHLVSPVFSETEPNTLSAAGANSKIAAPRGTLDACDIAYDTASALAASAQLDVRATAAGVLAASTAFHESKKAKLYQRALAAAMDAKPAARRPAAASFAFLLLFLLLFLLGEVDEKRATPAPEGKKDARPGEEEAATTEVEEDEGEVDRRPGWHVDGGSARLAGALAPRSVSDRRGRPASRIRAELPSEQCIAE